MTTLLPRGVHREPVLSPDGNPILLSVNAHHQEVQRRVVLPGENPLTVAALLWEHLDMVDPEHSRRRAGLNTTAAMHVAKIAAVACTSFALSRLYLLLDATTSPLFLS